MGEKDSSQTIQGGMYYGYGSSTQYCSFKFKQTIRY